MTVNYWQKIQNQLKEKNLCVFLGEKHGANVNPVIIDKFVRKLNIEVRC